MNLRMMLTLLLMGLLSTTQATEKVVYGDDHRLDLKDTVNEQHYQLAQSTAAMVGNSRVDVGEETATISGKLLKSRGICASARFANQMTAASCSGFLVAPDLMVTAGHCMRSKSDCRGSKWIFDFSVDAGSSYTPGESEMTVPASNVYSCKEIVERDLSRTTSNDYALIRLEREVTDREPLQYRTRSRGKVQKNTDLVVIGHPSGLPAKVAGGAWVRENNQDVYFEANLDTFGGNSGSAVFNAETGEVEGILVRGASDYTYDRNQGCRVPNQCENDGCRGEDVTRITNIDHLQDL